MTGLNLLIILYFSMIGLFIGSFLNVVAIRMLNKTSISYPPSHCMHCLTRLKILDLVPVFSYLLLRGQCRYCKKKISMLYSLGEVMTCLSFGLVTWQFGFSWEWFIGLFFVSILIIVVHTDLRSMVIPNRLVIIGVLGAVVLRVINHPLPWWDYLTASLAGSGILYLLALASKGGMGGGDIKLFLFIGLILGIKLTLLTIFVSSLLGVILGLVLVVRGRFQRNKFMPFGPFVALGSILVLIWGDSILQWYTDLLFIL